MGLDHNANPREDLTTYGEAAVQSGKMVGGVEIQLHILAATNKVYPSCALACADVCRLSLSSLPPQPTSLSFSLGFVVKLLHCTDLV
jgi:hypothetical protein